MNILPGKTDFFPRSIIGFAHQMGQLFSKSSKDNMKLSPLFPFFNMEAEKGGKVLKH